MLDAPLSGDAARRAAHSRRFEHGRVYTVDRRAGDARRSDVHRDERRRVARHGRNRSISTATIRIEVALAGATQTPPSSCCVTASRSSKHHVADARGQRRGACRLSHRGASAERLHAPEVPWLVCNPIYVDLRTATRRAGGDCAGRDHRRAIVKTDSGRPNRVPITQRGRCGRRGSDTGADADVAVLDWQRRPASSQLAAIACRSIPRWRPSTVSVPCARRRPVRVWVQLRVSAARRAAVGKTFYAGPELEPSIIPFADFTRSGADDARRGAARRGRLAAVCGGYAEHAAAASRRAS